MVDFCRSSLLWLVRRTSRVDEPELGLAEGDRVFFVRRGDEIVLKVLRGNILGLRGSIPARQRPENFDTIRKATKRKVASKITRDG